MANFRNSKRMGINQYALAAGAGLLRFFGLSVLGQTGPEHAETEIDYEPDPPEPIDGSAPVLTEVKPWTDTVDDIGVSFDSANLYAVRTAVVRQADAPYGERDDTWTAVPKALPSGYTATGRCGILGQLIADFIGPDPVYSPNDWQLRTPGHGVIPDLATADGQARAGWVPRNRGTQTYDTGTLVWGDLTDEEGGFYEHWGPSLFAGSHVGFRGGKMTVRCTTSEYNYGTIRFFAKNSDEVWDQFDDGETAPTQIGSESFDFDDDELGAEVEYDLSAMLALTLGKTANFWAVAQVTRAVRDEFGEPTGEEYTAAGGPAVTLRLSPRTDIPLHYFSSTGNRCAPGGIVEP